jgi:hypothetical protein
VFGIAGTWFEMVGRMHWLLAYLESQSLEKQQSPFCEVEITVYCFQRFCKIKTRHLSTTKNLQRICKMWVHQQIRYR